MTVEKWPTETAATAAVEAAAKALHETNRPPNGGDFPEWETLPALYQLQVREFVLPFVWAALQALPDPRPTAWVEGYETGIWDAPTARTRDNPYREA